MTEPAIEKLSLWQDEISEIILEQYKDSTKYLSCLKAVVDKVQELDDASVELPGFLELSSSDVGYHLDWLAGLINVKRINGESDADLLIRLNSVIGSDTAGTPDNVIRSSSFISDCELDDVILHEGLDAECNVFTPKGKQLHLYEVRRLVPSGVLGIPVAAIRFADGTYMADYSGNVIVAVADEKNAGNESPDNLKEIF